MDDAVEDPYCYPGTTVLKNKLKLKAQKELDEFEAEITAQRAEEPLPTGKLTYSHYRTIHKHLFQDVYVWAGKIRTVWISKGGSMFCYPESIDREMSKLFSTLAGQQQLRGKTPEEFCDEGSAFPRGAQCDPSVPRRQRPHPAYIPNAPRRDRRSSAGNAASRP